MEEYRLYALCITLPSSLFSLLENQKKVKDAQWALRAHVSLLQLVQDRTMRAQAREWKSIQNLLILFALKENIDNCGPASADIMNKMAARPQQRATRVSQD